MNTFILLFSTLCALYTQSFVEANKNLNGIKMELIHHNSKLSPFYNSSLTSSELITRAALRSISRSKRISHSQDRELSQESHESILIPQDGAYLTKICIGTPSIESLVIADTGSDLIWVQCSPCKQCFQQDTPYYNPKNSSTFMVVSCDSQPCSLLAQDQRSCENSNTCEYSYSYGDQSYTYGELSTDYISFGSMGGEGEKDVTFFPKSIFGCGHYNDIGIETNFETTGLVGLGTGPLSLVSQLGDSIGHKFSYCLVPLDSNLTSKLKFGDEAIINGNSVSTPILSKSFGSTYYYLNLDGITVGQNTVLSQIDSNIIIDSGTTLTFLEETFYNDLVDSLNGVIDLEVINDPPNPYKFCFASGDQMKFPDFVFHFTGADVTLQRENLVVDIDENLSCLAILPSNDISIFGNRAQVHFIVEYDLQEKTVSFAPFDCSNN